MSYMWGGEEKIPQTPSKLQPILHQNILDGKKKLFAIKEFQ